MTSTTLSTLRRPSPHFQRAINLKYDLGNADIIVTYVPTPNAARVIRMLLAATRPESTQRATLLHGPYGSGKSLLATVLASILSRDEERLAALTAVVERLREVGPETAQEVKTHLQAGPRLLPVILSGDEGDLSSALLRGLAQALGRAGLQEIRPRTHYQAVLRTIEMWQEEYPDTYAHLAAMVREEGMELAGLVEGLQQAEPEAYTLFRRLYPSLTAGAEFNNHYGQSVVDTYRETVITLREDTDYEGVVVLWDEFGRFLEDRTGEPFGQEAALLQEFAEFACRSGENQVHLVLIAHKVLGGYTWGLPDEYVREWQRIGERFRSLDVSGDQRIAYRLIASALEVSDPATWTSYLTAHQADLARALARTVEHRLFPELDEAEVRRWVLEGAYPLHPLTVYCLPRLSNKVAQNERTLFTFLAANEAGALQEHLARIPLDGTTQWVGVDALYDYFAEAMRADVAPGGVHEIWAAAQHALSKVPAEDHLVRRLVKALAVLQAIGGGETLRITTSMLAFALESAPGAVEQAAHYLARRKLARMRKADRTWELAAGSEVDIEAAIRDVLDRHLPTPLQLRRLLEEMLPLRFYLARRYNAERGMVRFFRGWYRFPDDVADTDWEMVLQEQDYVDGLIIYILTRNGGELNRARSIVEAVTDDRVLFVLPKKPLLIEEPLRELFALVELKNDPLLREQDERVIDELEFFIEDVTSRLERTLAPLVDPWKSGAEWYWQGEPWPDFQVDSPGQVTRLLSDVCDKVFNRTPVLRNEALNREQPSKVQVRAAERVIEALLTREPEANLGIAGHGPDWLIVQTILKAPGILRKEGDQWVVDMPTDEGMAHVWSVMEAFFERARETPQFFTDLLAQLRSPPFGIRIGVLPVLIAAALRRHLAVATIRRDRKPVLPLTGATFTDLCRHPERYTLELGPEDARWEALRSVLEARFGEHVLSEERRHQPLRYLSVGMIRWLRSLPRFAQTTQKVSEEARQFRRCIRRAANDPAPVLFEELPALLEGGADGRAQPDDIEVYREAIAGRLDALMGESETAYLDLLRRLDRFAVERFTAGEEAPPPDGRAALIRWADRIEAQCGLSLSSLRLGDVRAEGLLRAIRSESQARFWDRMGRALVGLPPRDWDDAGEERFYQVLAEAKAEVEREVVGLSTDTEETVEVTLQVGADGRKRYRFRRVGLSKQGRRLLRHFQSTLEVSGRPLSPDERRQVVVALLKYVMGEKDD